MQASNTTGFRSLIVWQEAKKLTLKIYELTGKFPKEELFAMTSQMRRASVSIGANLAEGSAMPTAQHRIAYYYRARGSAVEVDQFSDLSYSLHYISKEESDDLVDHCARIIHLISKLIMKS